MKSKKSYIIMSLVFAIGLFLGVVVTNKIGSNSEEEFSGNSSKQIKEKNLLSYYLENENGEYEVASSETWPTEGYKFNATLSKCENGGELAWDDTNKVVTMTGNMSDKCYIYFDKYNPTLAEYVISQYTGTQGENNIYYHNSTLSDGAGDNSYRYAGASGSVNNYVCFGSDEDTCPTDNLYRIIGVFGDQVKLIKADYANSNLLGTDGSYNSSTYAKSSYSGYAGAFDTINRYYWNTGDTNTWSASNLNTVNLNKNFITYLNSINTKWANMIADTTWKVGGNTYENISSVVAATAYKNEMTSTYLGTDGLTEYGPNDGVSKIGLMYVSDYGFAASSSAWTTTLSSYSSSSVTSVNWMYMGLIEWTISRRGNASSTAFYVSWDGDVDYDGVNYYNGNAVRPVFYLVSLATYSSGTGTSSDPIRFG